MIISTADYMTFAGLTAPLTNEKQVLEAIRAAIQYAETLCSCTFAIHSDVNPTTHIWTFGGKGTAKLYTPNAPIQSVTYVEYWNGTDWEEIDSVTYTPVIDDNGDYIYFRENYTWDRGTANWRVTYIYGFTSLPADLKRAILQIAQSYTTTITRDPSIKSQSDGEQTITYREVGETTIPTEAERTLQQYRRFY